MASESLVSCLCVTERRSAFMPWLLWNFDKQTYGAKELIIVDSSPEPFESDRDDVRVIRATPGTNVPAKRNLALEACHGDIVAWFDDDDWQHPERLEKLVAALDEQHDYAGSSHSWFLDLHGGNCAQYFGHGALIFNGAGFTGNLARSVRFNEGVRKASDTVWLRDLAARRPRLALLEDRLTLWLCHDQNISNARSRRRFPSALEQLKQALGQGAWGDTDERLQALRDALPPPLERPSFRRPAEDGEELDDYELEPFSRRSRALGGRHRLLKAEPPRDRVRAEPVHVETATLRAARAPLGPSSSARPEEAHDLAVEKPEVSLVVMVDREHLPYVDVLAKHVLFQSKYGFVEKRIVVDEPAGDASLPPVVSGFDRIVAALQSPDEIVERYFAPGARRPAGGARALAELGAVAHASSDLVLFCRSGVLFHASGNSWVREAVQRMKADPTLYTMTTHPGPPAGPVGHPRSWPAAAGHSQWDRRLRIWRGRDAFSSYCLLDRKKLLGALPELGATLVDSISSALGKGSAMHGSVATKGSWALDATRAVLPSGDWLPALSALVAEGVVPPRQVGHFELALSEPSAAEAWGRLVGRAQSARAA